MTDGIELLACHQCAGLREQLAALRSELEQTKRGRDVAVANRDALAAEWLIVTTAYPPPKDDEQSLGAWTVAAIERANARTERAIEGLRRLWGAFNNNQDVPYDCWKALDDLLRELDAEEGR